MRYASRLGFIGTCLGTLLLSGCIKAYHEQRIGEELWEIGYTDIEVCDKAADADRCIKEFTPEIAGRGQELCGDRLKAEVEACEKTQRKGLYAVVCKVKCADRQTAARTIPIRIATDAESSFEQSTGQLRVIINSKKVKSLFSGAGISVVLKVDKDSYVLSSDKDHTCVHAQTFTSEEGEVSLKDAESVDCKAHF